MENALSPVISKDEDAYAKNKVFWGAFSGE